MSPFEDLGKGWFKCSQCGATWIEVPPLGPSALSTERDDTTGERKYKSRAISRKGKAKA